MNLKEVCIDIRGWGMGVAVLPQVSKFGYLLEFTWLLFPSQSVCLPLPEVSVLSCRLQQIPCLPIGQATNHSGKCSAQLHGPPGKKPLPLKCILKRKLYLQLQNVPFIVGMLPKHSYFDQTNQTVHLQK